MNLDKRRVYFNALFGAIGGWLAWGFISLVMGDAPSSLLGLFVQDGLRGAVIGASIGIALGSMDGLLRSRSRRRTLRGAVLGGLIGLAGGAIGLLAGEVVFKLTGGGVWPRAAGWALFGAVVGSAEGVAARSPSRRAYGLLGGFLGGLIGGSTYERLSILVRGATGNRELALAVGGAVGLILLGACIGAMIGVVEDLLRPAWLRFLLGRLEGETRTLDPRRTRTTLGSDDRCDIVLCGDAGVQGYHAEIQPQGNAFVLLPLQGEISLKSSSASGHGKSARTNGTAGERRITGPYVLQSGDVIEMGQTRFVFDGEEAR